MPGCWVSRFCRRMAWSALGSMWTLRSHRRRGPASGRRCWLKGSVLARSYGPAVAPAPPRHCFVSSPSRGPLSACPARTCQRSQLWSQSRASGRQPSRRCGRGVPGSAIHRWSRCRSISSPHGSLRKPRTSTRKPCLYKCHTRCAQGLPGLAWTAKRSLALSLGLACPPGSGNPALCGRLSMDSPPKARQAHRQGLRCRKWALGWLKNIKCRPVRGCKF